MNRPLRIITLLGVIAVSLPVACTAQQSGGERTADAISPVPSTAPPAGPMVTGLPDFTHLVEQVAPAVVNISAEIAAPQTQGHPEVPEFFRRFFGPGMPPGMGPPGPREGGTSLGSGFLISADGYVLTNHHVIAGADTVTVTLSDRREFEAEVVGSDEQYDVALLKIDGENLPALRTGSSHALQAGQWVVAIGSPFGLEHSVTAGIVSAVGRANPGQQYVPFIQTDVAINRGNSGGPLLNTSGEVVGINSQIFSNSGGYMGVSFAIPIDLAMNAVNQIKETGYVSRGQLGVQVQPVSPDGAQAIGLPDSRGALVSHVVPGSAAAEAGFERMDVIRMFDGKPVGDFSDLPPLVGSTAPGSQVEVTVFRGGENVTLDVVLGELGGPVAGAPGPTRAPGMSPGEHAAANALGLVTRDLTPAQRRQLGLQDNEGVLVTNVESQAAREARLSAGDVILAVGRESVGDAAALDRELADVEPGDTVMLLVRKDRGTQFIAVTAEQAG